MARELHTAKLVRKQCLSQSAQCFHLEFVIDAIPEFVFRPGQFISVGASDPHGKHHTRAYSIASAPNGNRFDLCLNRVEDGFLSNLLPDLKLGETVQIHGPHGFFTLREPITDSIFVGAGTGVAPMRGFLQHLFPAAGPDRSAGKHIWLVYGADREDEFYYRDEFEALALRHAHFRYLPTPSRSEDSWLGLRGEVADYVAGIAEELILQLGVPLRPPAPDATGPEQNHPIHAYVCGLNNQVSAVRERLKHLGWHRKQIIVERYD